VLPKLLFRVELPNGHRIIAHVASRLRDQAAAFVLGERVEVVMTPFDMSQGRISARK